jgi:hypothetical protein
MSERPAIHYIDEAPDARPVITYIGTPPPQPSAEVAEPNAESRPEKRAKKPKEDPEPLDPAS